MKFSCAEGSWDLSRSQITHLINALRFDSGLSPKQVQKIWAILQTTADRVDKTEERLLHSPCDTAEKPCFFSPWELRHCLGGWAVIQHSQARDSSSLHVVRVTDLPGSTGEVEVRNKNYKQNPRAEALGPVQMFRAQARAQKLRLCREKRLRLVSAREYWDADE